MHLFREINEKDSEDVYRLACEAHAGITSLPKDKRLIKEKIDRALSSFSHFSKERENLYFFGLEDKEQKKLIGVSAIKTRIEGKNLLNHYKITKDKREKKEKLQGVQRETTLLLPEKEKHSFSELCSLFLERKERHLGLGILLSLSRFLFIKLQRPLFNREIKATLRGVFDEKDRSPFWEHVGFQYVKMSYDAFVDLARVDPSLILSTVPTYPMTIELMDKEASQVIGVPHPNTQPAKHLLESLGMYSDSEVDLLDAGPIFKGEIDSLKPLLHAETTSIFAIKPLNSSTKGLVAKNILPFESAMGPTLKNENGIIVEPLLAKTLSLQVGSPVLYLQLE